MNVLLKGPNSPVKYSLQLFENRSIPIRVIMWAQTLGFGYYLYKPGSKQLRSHTFQDTRMFNPWSFALNMGTLYTLGNYHVAKHGSRHFMAFYFGSMAAWFLFSNIAGPSTNIHRNYQYVGTAGAATIIGYNAFRNPGFFKVASPQTFVASLFFYGLFWNDSMMIKGLLTGFAGFLFI